MGTPESTAGAPAAAPARPRISRRRARRPRAVDPRASTRIEILQSAAALFRRLGYHGATVEQIAAALHMKKGNLYYYFKNKEAILYACHQYSLDRLLETLAAIERGNAAPDEKLRQLIVSFVHTILDELHGTALFLDLEALTPAHLKAVILRRDRFDRGMRHIVNEGIAGGLFPGADARLLSFAILGAVNWIPRWYDPAGRATSQEIADRFADYLVAGLRHAAVASGPAARAGRELGSESR